MSWIQRVLITLSVVLATVIADIVTLWWTPLHGFGLFCIGVCVLCAYHGCKLIARN